MTKSKAQIERRRSRKRCGRAAQARSRQYHFPAELTTLADWQCVDWTCVDDDRILKSLDDVPVQRTVRNETLNAPTGGSRCPKRAKKRRLLAELEADKALKRLCGARPLDESLFDDVPSAREAAMERPSGTTRRRR